MPGSNLANLTAARISAGQPNLEFGLLKSLGKAVIATDLDGYIVFWNRTAQSLYGWTADEVQGRNILDVILTDSSRAAGVAIFEKLTQGESWSGEFETRHKDGHSLLVHVTDYPVRDQQGRLTAIVGISNALAEAEAVRAQSPEDFAGRLVHAVRAGLDFVYLRIRNYSKMSAASSFAIAVVLYGLALTMRVLLDEIIPDRLPFLSFFPAIVVSAFLCGFWPTITLLVASGITGAAFLEAPDPDHQFRFRVLVASAFVLFGGLVSAPAIYSTYLIRRLTQKDEQVTMLNRELKHRIKNVFAVVNSIIGQTIRSNTAISGDLAAAISGRIQALATAQDLLDPTEEKGADLRALVEATVRPLAPDASRLQIDGPSLLLTSETTTPFTLILHELATNAAKYGAWSSGAGEVLVQWHSSSDNQVEFLWREKNVVLKTTPIRKGFGTTVIKRALPQAKVRHEIGADGLVCQINFYL